MRFRLRFATFYFRELLTVQLLFETFFPKTSLSRSIRTNIGLRFPFTMILFAIQKFLKINRSTHFFEYNNTHLMNFESPNPDLLTVMI